MFDITRHHVLFSRAFAIVAEFVDSDEGVKVANAYMEANPGVGVLEVIGDRVLLASNDDKGIEVTGQVRRMLCSCCGAVTKGRQWHNRDTGYGLCVECIPYCQRGETHETFQKLYGLRGVHFDVTN